MLLPQPSVRHALFTLYTDDWSENSQRRFRSCNNCNQNVWKAVLEPANTQINPAFKSQQIELGKMCTNQGVFVWESFLWNRFCWSVAVNNTSSMVPASSWGNLHFSHTLQRWVNMHHMPSSWVGRYTLLYRCRNSKVGNLGVVTQLCCFVDQSKGINTVYCKKVLYSCDLCNITSCYVTGIPHLSTQPKGSGPSFCKITLWPTIVIWLRNSILYLILSVFNEPTVYRIPPFLEL